MTITVYVRKDDHYAILSENEVDELFSDMLDECYPIEVAGITIRASRALAECDPIAYRTFLNDWADGEFEEMDMPEDIYYSDDEEVREEWVGRTLGDDV